MLRFLRSFFSQPSELSAIRTQLELLTQQKAEERESRELATVRLLRHFLGSIDGTDLPAETSTDIERFNMQVGAIYDTLKPKLERMSRLQERFTAATAQDWYQTVFGRGTLNGIELVLEELKTAHSAYVAASEPKERFNQNSTIPE